MLSGSSCVQSESVGYSCYRFRRRSAIQTHTVQDSHLTAVHATMAQPPIAAWFWEVDMVTPPKTYSTGLSMNPLQINIERLEQSRWCSKTAQRNNYLDPHIEFLTCKENSQGGRWHQKLSNCFRLARRSVLQMWALYIFLAVSFATQHLTQQYPVPAYPPIPSTRAQRVLTFKTVTLPSGEEVGCGVAQTAGWRERTCEHYHVCNEALRDWAAKSMLNSGSYRGELNSWGLPLV